MEWIARGVHRAELDPGVVEVALKLVACRRVVQQRRQIQVRPGAPCPDAHLHVGDVVGCGPRQGGGARQVLESVGEEPDPHELLLCFLVALLVPGHATRWRRLAASRNPSSSAARSSRAASTEARTGAPVVIAAWNARSSFRKASS